MQEENFLKVRDISKKLPTPLKDPITSPLSPKRVESPVNLENQGRGKRVRTLTTPCKLASCCGSQTHSHKVSGNIYCHVARILDFDEDLQFFGNSFEAPPASSDDAIPDDGDPDYIDEIEELDELKPKKRRVKRLRPMFENVIAFAARRNADPTQVALWINLVAL